VENVPDMSPNCHRVMTMSPNCGDKAHVAWHLPSQSLFKGLSHVSCRSVIALLYYVLVKRWVNMQMAMSPIFPLHKQHEQHDGISASGPSPPSISMSLLSFQLQVGTSSSYQSQSPPQRQVGCCITVSLAFFISATI
jgi:hypothetical protein